MTNRVGAGLLLLALCAPRIHAQSAPPDAASLSPGDLIRIAVWRQPELSGEFPIATDGTLVHPLYRDIRVIGVPFAEVESRIRQVLAQYTTDPQFVFEPLLRVAVGGEVGRPNVYRLPPGTTIAEAVAQAGGPTQAAKLGSVRLVRAGQELRVDLRRPHTELAATSIRSGDQIVIDRRGSFVRDVLTPIASLTAAIVAVVNIAIK